MYIYLSLLLNDLLLFSSILSSFYCYPFFNADFPINIVKQIIAETMRKRPRIKLYIEVEDCYLKMIYLLHEYGFEECDHNNLKGFFITPESVTDWASVEKQSTLS